VNETVIGEKGMVVAPHSAAAEAGAEAMRAGGNAVEAIVAAAATIAVVYPHMNGIGGDAFFLIAEPGRPPRAIDACGAAGSLATIDRYQKAGYDAVPPRGVYGALTVPGAVSGWGLALELAAALGGRLGRTDLLANAIRTAKAGSAVTRSHAGMAAEHLDELKEVPGFASGFLIDGKPPKAGATFVQDRLADTLDHIARAGCDDFYRGDIAAEIATDLERIGAVVTRDDLRRHRARVVEPLSTEISAATLFNLPPPTQGLASLILLGLFDRLGVKRVDGFDHIHGLIESAKRAAAVRDREVTDPDHVGDIGFYLQPAWLDAEAARIDRRRVSNLRTAAASGDTIWMGAIDGNGLAVSFIQSLYWEFGSGVVLPRTGIILQNRGSSFSLDPKSRNPLTPGRKPFHTLNPPLARCRDGRVISYGSMGGDGQPQFQAQILTRYLLGMDPGDAVDAPRFRVGTTWGRQAMELLLENRFDSDLIAGLERAGHPVTVSDAAYLDGMGHAGMIVRRPDGRLLGSADPRADGAAVAV
jgi:gamma-glutamyltranspeptidase/glutathione hydrolase